MYAYQLIIVAVVITESIVSVSGCSCAQETDEDIYCRSQWVSFVRIRSKNAQKLRNIKVPRSVLNYTVEHLYTFKKPPNVKDLPTTITTPAESSLCGVDYPEVGQCYLLAGVYNENSKTLSINLCGQFHGGTNSKWSSLPIDFRRALFNDQIKCGK